jgi:hypothetical protein
VGKRGLRPPGLGDSGSHRPQPQRESAVEIKSEIIAGQDRVAWNPGLSIPPKEFEFSPAEAVRIRTAIEAWDPTAPPRTSAGSNLSLPACSPLERPNATAKIRRELQSDHGLNGMR